MSSPYIILIVGLDEDKFLKDLNLTTVKPA